MSVGAKDNNDDDDDDDLYYPLSLAALTTQLNAVYTYRDESGLHSRQSLDCYPHISFEDDQCRSGQ